MAKCNFETAKKIAIESVKNGHFILSSGSTSDYWININDLTRNIDVFEALKSITEDVLKNIRADSISKYQDTPNIVIPKFIDAYHNDSFTECIISLANTEKNDIIYIKEKKVGTEYKFVHRNSDAIKFSGTPCILVLPVSSYTRSLYEMIDILKNLFHSKKMYFYTFLFREIKLLKKLINRNIEVIPVLISFSKNEIYSIEDINNPDFSPSQNVKDHINNLKKCEKYFAAHTNPNTQND